MKNKRFKWLLRTLLVLMALQGQRAFAQIPPTFTYDQTYGLLAADSIITTDTIKVNGDAGAGTFIQGKVKADHRYVGGTTITNAQSDLASAKSYLSGQSGTSISGTLDGQSLAAGVYTITGNAILNDTLILTGDTDAIYIFNISGNLSINPGAIVLTTIFHGVKAGNIFWNIGGQSTLKDSCVFGGLVLGAGDISILNTFMGDIGLLSQSTIRISGPQGHSNAGGNFGYAIKSYDLILRSTANCVPTGTLTCGELILNGNFEELNSIYSPICPDALLNDGSIIDFDLQYCGWLGGPHGTFTPSTLDAFNTCATGTGAWTSVPTSALGYQNPHSGSGYIGLFAGFGTLPTGYESLQRDFPAGTLVSGKVYYVEMWTSLAEVSNVASRLGVRFADGTGIGTYSYLYPTAITDKVNWTPIRTCFTATGTEEHMFIDNSGWPAGPYTPVASTPGYILSGPTTPYSYYFLDDVSLKPLADAGPDQSVCTTAVLGSCSAIPGATYSWAYTSGPGTASFSSTTVYNPTVTLSGPVGSYTFTVTVTYGGCTDVDQVVVTKLPSPSSVLATASPYTIVLGNSSSLTGSASGGFGLSYTWSPATGLSSTTGTSVTATPTSTTTYTLTVHNLFGCSTTDTVVVHVVDPKCSLASYDYTVPSTGAYATVIFGPATITNKNILVNGDLTMDYAVTFDNCNFVVAAGKKIILSNSIVEFKNYTHLYSCGDMWDGVYITDIHSTLKINTNAMIENALNAVVSQSGGPFTINTAIFNRNRKGVDVQTYVGTHPGTIKNTIFTSRYIPTYAVPTSNPSVATLNSTLTSLLTASMPSPYSGQKGVVGVTVADVTTFNVGAATAGLTNVFDAIQCGIDATNTNMTIYNNTFQNLLNSTVCGSCYGFNGHGIQANATTGTYTINIGGSLSNQPNTFLNTYKAIKLTNYQTNSIKNNSIDNTVTGTGSIDYGNMGIYVQPSGSNSITVTDNTVNNCQTGIWLSRNNSITTTAVALKVDNNTVTANSSGFCNTGIYVPDYPATGTAASPSEINGNIVTNSASCIYVLNAQKPIMISTNSVTAKYASTGSQYGIRLNGCQNIVVNNNHTKYDVTTAGLSGGNLNAYGIYLSGSTNMTLKCNIIQDAARSLTFVGACSSPTSGGYGITQNTMRRAQDGFVLISGVIGQQGTTGSPANNYWDMSTSPNFTRSQTYTQSTTGANTASKLYMNSVTTGASATMPVNNQTNGVPADVYTLGTGLNSTTGTPTACGFVPALGLHGDTKDEEMDSIFINYLTELATNSIPMPVYSEEVNYQLDQYAFSEVYNNEFLQLDETLGTFYLDNYNAPIGALRRFNDYVLASDLSSAESINSGIIPSNIIEQNQQSVNIIVLNQLSDSAYTYNGEDIETLSGIANQCPVYGGHAVFQARAMLTDIAGQVLDFEDNCEEEPRFSNNGSIETKSHLFNLYPNPNNGNMTLSYYLNETEKGEIKLFNSTGQLVGSYILNPTGKQLSIGLENLASGLYNYQVIVNNKLIKSAKVIISK